MKIKNVGNHNLVIQWSPVISPMVPNKSHTASFTAASNPSLPPSRSQLEPIESGEERQWMFPTGFDWVCTGFFEGWLTSKWHVLKHASHCLLSSLILLFGNSNQRDIGADKPSRHRMFNSPDYESKFSKFPYLTQISHTILPREENKHTKTHNSNLQVQVPRHNNLAAMTFTLGPGAFQNNDLRDPSSMGGMNLTVQAQPVQPTTGPTTPEASLKRTANFRR